MKKKKTAIIALMMTFVLVMPLAAFSSPFDGIDQGLNRRVFVPINV